MLYASVCNQARVITARALAGPLSPAAWRASLADRRRRWRAMLGLDPLPPRTPLQATVTARLARGDYVVEMLHFQSLPGVYVPGNLYRPAHATGRLPAVLYLCGHSRAGKAEPRYQAEARWFARHGYVALALDTIEIGESTGNHHGTCSLGRWDWISRGYTPAGIEVWNAMRALDYLETRPEVDPARLGVTGLSGGGAMSWFLGAADERVRCVAPVCQTGSIAQVVVDRSIDLHCDCAFWINYEQWCTPDIGALIAPRPLLVAAGSQDTLWRPYAYRQALRRVRRQYAALGAPDKVRLVEEAAPHGYTPRLSRAIYAWFNRHLRGDPGPAEGEDTAPDESPSTLRAFPGRRPADDATPRADLLLPRLAPRPDGDPRTWDRTRRGLLAALRAGPFRHLPPAGGLARRLEMRDDGTAAGRTRRSFLFGVRDGLRLRLRSFAPADRPSRPIGLVYALDPAAHSGASFPGAPRPPPGLWTACVEVRNTGESSVGPGYLWTLRRTYPLFGQSLPERQVGDLLAGLSLLRRETGIRRWAVYGREYTAVLAIYAALLDPDVVELVLEAPPTTHADPATPEIPGILRLGDLPVLLGAFYPRPIAFLGGAPPAYRWTRRLYQRLGAADRVRIVPAGIPWTPRNTPSARKRSRPQRPTPFAMVP